MAAQGPVPLNRRSPANVCFGSLADIKQRIGDVCFTPKSGRAASPPKESAMCHKRTSWVAHTAGGLARLLAQHECAQSPSHRKTGEENVGVIFIGDDLSNERMPNVLIARDQPNCRGDGEVVEDFDAFLIGDLRSSGRQLRDVAFQVAADLIIEKANAEAVVFSAREAMRKQCDARIARNLIGLLRREADATDDPDAIEHLSSFELFGYRRRIISQKEIL